MESRLISFFIILDTNWFETKTKVTLFIGIKKLIQKLKNYIKEICKISPRILIILDCCYAHAVGDLFPIKLDDDTHVEWHAKWMSWKKTKSRISVAQQLNAFTEVVVSAIKGRTERPCLNWTQKCESCMKFRKLGSENGFMNLNDCAKFVTEHMHSIGNVKLRKIHVMYRFQFWMESLFKNLLLHSLTRCQHCTLLTLSPCLITLFTDFRRTTFR